MAQNRAGAARNDAAVDGKQLAQVTHCMTNFVQCRHVFTFGIDLLMIMPVR
ncbi:Uncharacterised protein [Vibrio cholerae]|nr:Uncharacterised protein [Vibrio cholerae]